MKRILLSLTVSLLAAVSVRADIIFTENFNYLDGQIVVTGTNSITGNTNWFRHSGTGNDAFVKNKRLEVSATGGSVSRQDDVNRRYETFTNAQTLTYASFSVICTNISGVPAAGGYLAHHLGVGNVNNLGRVYAVPGTSAGMWRLGIAAQGATANKVFPVDLLTNVSYQVVSAYDAAGAFATLWVNPVSSSDLNFVTSDAVTGGGLTAIIGSYAFRQAGTFGNSFFAITNLACATTFEEAATNVWSTNAVAPVILVNPTSGTNFTGNSATLFGMATGQGLGSLTYTWLKNGSPVANPNTNAITFPSAAVSDSGNYQLVATTPFGLSATSAVAFLWVTNATVPPTISVQPTNQTVLIGGTATIAVGATGPGTITYTWLTNGVPVSGGNYSGENSAVLTITGAQLANALTYRVAVSNEYGGLLSANAVLTVTNPPAVSIAYLRTLVDTVNYNATNSTQVWQATGTVTTFTNLTSGNTSSYYLQDSTAGINIFATLGSSFRPAQGDVVTFKGILSSFGSTLELLADPVSNPASGYFVHSNNIALLPEPKPIPFNITNNLPFCETNLEGSIVMLTNVFFGTNAGTTISTSANQTITVTNAQGETFLVFFAFLDLDTAGQTLPSFANTIVGPFTQNQNNTALPRNANYSVTVTRFSDIVTNPLTLSIARSGSTNSLSWSAAPYSYSYSVRTATNVSGPYAPEYQQFNAILIGSNEFPANSSTASGYGTVVLSPDQTTITVNENWTGLTTPASASHIHGPAGPGANAGVLFPFSGVPAATAGAIPQQSFSITPTQVGYLRSGLLYMNVHDATYPGGEIRAQLLPVPLRFPTPSGTFEDAAPGGEKYYRLTTP